jgi:2-polyprenyl-6-methoxyphenol hydroxylase-like FAD-dependent oxidoreductase
MESSPSYRPDVSTDLPVLVVGAGPTGLLLSAELNRRGINCQLIDANPGPLHWDRATVVHPRTLEVFESLGIVQPLLAAGVKQCVARLHAAGSVLGEIDLALCGSRYGFNLGISEEVTESILTDYLHQHRGEVIRSARLVAVVDRGDSLVATIERQGSTEQITVQWIVGCDGLHSTTRQATDIELAGHEIAQPWAVFDATVPGWSQSYEACYAYLDEIPVILTALPNRRWRVYLHPSSPQSDLVADAAQTIGRYLPNVAFDDVTNPTRFHCHTRVATRFRAGRILLAGDAAHVCSPAQGHGMNSGLQDAFNLAWKLALVCQGHSAATLLDSYEAERRPVAQSVTTAGDAFERSQFSTRPADRRTRDATLRETFANPTSRHHEAIAEAELDIDYSGSPIVMGDVHELLAPGQRLPDTIEVDPPAGKARWLHELTHRAGHTALVVGGRAAAVDQLAPLEALLRSQSHKAMIEAMHLLALESDCSAPWTKIAPAMAERLGVAEITLLVVRPDGHVGLRADRDHLNAFLAYQALLAAGGV